MINATTALIAVLVFASGVLCGGAIERVRANASYVECK